MKNLEAKVTVVAVAIAIAAVAISLGHWGPSPLAAYILLGTAAWSLCCLIIWVLFDAIAGRLGIRGKFNKELKRQADEAASLIKGKSANYDTFKAWQQESQGILAKFLGTDFEAKGN